VMALNKDAQVYVEATEESHRKTGVYYWYADCSALISAGDHDEFIMFARNFGNRLGKLFRVWSLPQPPTQEEMDANPWRKEGEASE
jgi:geranylgeranyl pyrophosphate synthase